MPFLKGTLATGRVKIQHGIDLTNSVHTTLGAGASIKFYGTYPATMGYYHATYGGVYIYHSSLYAVTVSGDDAGKTHARALHVEGRPTGTSEVAAGCVRIIIDRTSSYPFGATGTGGWGGAPDEAVRIQALARAANTSSVGGLRALNVYARQYSGGQIANLYGALIDTDDRGSGGADGKSVSTIQTLTVAQRVNGVAGTMANVLVVEDNSQGTLSTTTCTAQAMVKIRSTQPTASGARASGIHFETSGSGTGWTNAFSFQTATGKEGFTALTNAGVQGNIDGYIKVYDVANSATLYIALYDTVPS